MGIKTRFLVISDTHDEDLPGISEIPTADVAIHCGDLTEESYINEFRKTLDLLRIIKAPLKLVIAGNHDFTLDTPIFRKKVTESQVLEADVRKFYGDYGEARQIFDDARVEGIVFLDEGTHKFDLDNGATLTVYASPFTASLKEGGFQFDPREGHDFNIAKGVDIVITHSPPHGIMDLTDSKERAGCPALFSAVARARPKLHCFGHIHEEWGARLVTWRGHPSETPSHFTDIDNNKSRVIEKLGNMRERRNDTPRVVLEKAARRLHLHQQGYIRTSHCTRDETPLQSGSQTLFVNAAIEYTLEEDSTHVPWLVEIELPRAVQ
ncbi:Metallo-dependent phosphatase [Hypoxylon fuscum]|nr:Metallo-dependent phosphatase [Hypoxylon fuscum]